MSVKYVEKTEEINEMIDVCKSNSGVSGLRLRNAHYKLGNCLAKIIYPDVREEPLALIIMMRAGLCFGMGIADELSSVHKNISILFYSNDAQWENEKNNHHQLVDSNVLIVDAVINTGAGILHFSKQFNRDKVLFAVNVISERALGEFSDKKLYVIRDSKNSFVGSKSVVVKDNKGPDTGDRLFNTQ